MTVDAARRLRRYGLMGGTVLVGAALVTLAWSWIDGSRLSAPPSVQPVASAPAAASAHDVFARCTRAMVQGSCQVMGARDRPPASTAQASQRVFVAGVGEVDAAVYERLRGLGDAMCGEVRRACEQNWNGSDCRIAQALYPPAR